MDEDGKTLVDEELAFLQSMSDEETIAWMQNFVKVIGEDPARFGLTAEDLAPATEAFAKFEKSVEECKVAEAEAEKAKAKLAEAGARLVLAEAAEREKLRRKSSKSQFPH